MISEFRIEPDSICSERFPLIITLVSATIVVMKCNQSLNIKNVQSYLVKENKHQGSK